MLITDNNSCDLSDTFTINEPALLVSSATIQNVTFNGLSNGSIN
ncbi:MAG: hypothetical protein R2852_04625 [Bacteroidia bacterium]